MKLQPALIFGENMVLQRGEPLPVWGRSVRGDKVTVTLGGNTAVSDAPQGEWKVTLPAMEATEQTEMAISSQLTGESVTFRNVAVGEVWLAGGQSNMEFLLKYDEQAPEMLETPEDPGFRFFRYPQANFTGCLEMDPYPDDGFWRVWDTPENKGFFSGPSAYMGRKLREALGVPVGFIGVNWGGTPAAAWTAMEDLEQNPALKTVLDWHKEGCAALDLAKYYTVSDKPQPEPSQADQERLERFMMGIGFEEMVGKPPMRLSLIHICPLAIETSGHAAMRENHFLDDGAYLVTKILIKMASLRKEGKDLNDLLAPLREPMEATEVRLPITEEDFRARGQALITALETYAQEQNWAIAPDNREGIRVSFPKGEGEGWFLLRLSVHDPILPVNFESDAPGGNKLIAQKLLAFLEGHKEGIDITPLEQFV